VDRDPVPPALPLPAVGLFRIISGEKPWPSGPSHATEEATLQLQFRVETEQWKLVSDQGKDLVRKLLAYRDERLTAEQVLNHPWLSDQTDSILRKHPPSGFTGPRARMASRAFIEPVREQSEDVSRTASNSSGGAGPRFWIRRAVQEALSGLMVNGGYQGRVVVEQDDFVMVEECMAPDAMPLPDYVAQCPRYTEAECRAICQNLAKRIHAFHSAKVAHRYLHPENIVIETVDGIEGFNLSIRGIRYAQIVDTEYNLTGRVGHSQRTMDWYAFIAPEIDSDFTHDAQVDLWSLGAIFYTLLCGVGPFTGDKTTLRRNKLNGQVNFDIVQPSASAMRLVRDLLQVTPKARLSIEDVLNHEWMRSPEEQLSRNELDLARSMFGDWGRRATS